MRTGSHPTTTKSQNCVRSLGGKGVQVVVWPREAVLPTPTLRLSNLDPSNYLLRHPTPTTKAFPTTYFDIPLRLQKLFRLPPSNILALAPKSDKLSERRSAVLQNPIYPTSADVCMHFVVDSLQQESASWQLAAQALNRLTGTKVLSDFCEIIRYKPFVVVQSGQAGSKSGL